MATATLELYDGSTTIDLMSGSYVAQFNPGLNLPRPPSVPIISANQLTSIDFSPKTIAMTVLVVGTDQADLTDKIRDLSRMVAEAQERQMDPEGRTFVLLKYQRGNTNANDISVRVISGGFSPGRDVLSEINVAGSFKVNGVLTLIVEPFGRLPDVTLGRKRLHNEIDNTEINYVDIGDGWGGYYSFDGAATVVTVTDHASIQNRWDAGGYLRIRFRLDDLATTNALVSKGTWEFDVDNSGELVFQHNWAGNDGVWTSTDASIAVGTWYIAEVEYNSDSAANNVAFKLNGATLTVTTTTTPTGASRDTDVASNLLIGTDIGSANWGDGDISECALYSASGITDSITQQLDGDETNLAAYWSFEEGTGTSVRDNSSNTNNGTITPGAGSWGIDPTKGDAGGLLQVRIEEGTGGTWNTGKVLYMGPRSGERRTDSLFIQAHTSATAGTDPSNSNVATFSSGTTGGLTTNASGGASSFMRWTWGSSNAWDTGRQDLGYSTYQIAGASLPRGVYRVLLRVSSNETVTPAYDHSEVAIALGYSFGGKSKTPTAVDEVAIPANSADTWYLLDLGELEIPNISIPEDYTPPALDLRLHWIWNQSGAGTPSNTEYVQLSLDYLFLLPIDEGSVIVNSVDNTDEVLADLITTPPGVWLLNTSSVPQQIADFNGGPIMLPPAASRLYWLKDDTGDPSSIVAYAYLKYTPLVATV